jgi:hypothetical protein
MKHVTMAEKNLLIGDEAAELLIEYAALLARNDEADTVELSAIGQDGDPVEVTFLLNSGTVLLLESSYANFAEPDNADAEDYLRSRIEAIENPPMAGTTERQPESSEAQWDL